MLSITALLQQRQKDLDFRAEIMERINNADKEKVSLAQQIDRLTNQKKSIESERDTLLAKSKQFEKNLKDER